MLLDALLLTPMENIDPTQTACPASKYGETHHLVPKGGVPTCTYCGKARAVLVEEIRNA